MVVVEGVLGVPSVVAAVRAAEELGGDDGAGETGLLHEPQRTGQIRRASPTQEVMGAMATRLHASGSTLPLQSRTGDTAVEVSVVVVVAAVVVGCAVAAAVAAAGVVTSSSAGPSLVPVGSGDAVLSASGSTGTAAMAAAAITNQSGPHSPHVREQRARIAANMALSCVHRCSTEAQLS